MAAGLHARVADRAFNHQIKLQLKVAVLFLRDQKGVARIHDGSAHDGAIFHFVVGRARQALPALQGLAIKEFLPIISRTGRGLVGLNESQDYQGETRQQESVGFQDVDWIKGGS